MMFSITPAAKKYILKKGSAIKVYLELYQSAGGWCGNKTVSSRIPTVRLGEPDIGEKKYFLMEENDGIKIWYAKNIRSEVEGQAIIIDLRKIFLSSELTITGAKFNLTTT